MKHRSLAYWTRRLLGLLFVFTGIGFLWLAWHRVDGWIGLRRLRRYRARLRVSTTTRVPRRRFPLSYFRRRLHAGMAVDEVDRAIVGYKDRRVETEHIGRGTYAIVYEFSFTYTRKHELIAIFDNTGLVRLDGIHLTFDIG